jgi:DNA gyrase subunit A
MMATRRGTVKKTPLEQYGRPMKRGIIAINLKEGDELIAVTVVKEGEEIVLSSARGQATRFRQSAARPMGRSASGVRGIKLREGDSLVGMVVADPDATLLTVCEYGYGKRTPFGPNAPPVDAAIAEGDEDAEESSTDVVAEREDETDESTSARYPTKGRGTMGVRDIKTTERNGMVIAVASVRDGDELMMMTARGKIQRIAASDVSVIGRNTQGVRIMSLDEGDTLAGVVRVPPEEADSAESASDPGPAGPGLADSDANESPGPAGPGE